MLDTLKRTWWLVLAALVAGLELVVAVGIWIDKLIRDTVLINGTEVELPGEALLAWGDIALTGLLALAAAAITVGSIGRASQPDRSRGLIVTGLVPAALIGVVFFWFPPFW
ncbi:MAG: hypothetical protein HKN80_11970, partial [Acidimicrobiia bacterium]|nr:hypothetical protein [Acidimicrobiia bacterium]